MALAMAILSPFLSVLLMKLASPEMLRFVREVSIGPKLKNWEPKLLVIQAAMEDAQEKQLTTSAVKMWLDNLHDLFYNMEEIHDEIFTDASRRMLEAKHHSTSNTSKYLKIKMSHVSFHFGINRKLNRISKRLKELSELRTTLGLIETSSSTGAAAYQRPQSTSIPTEAVVYGTDGDKDEILNMLSRDEPSDANLCAISIVGMGGIGKTTLAREVFNDKAVVKDFNPRVWVCVSNHSDVFTLSPYDWNDLNIVLNKLRDAIAGKKFLLVLDNVWIENCGFWETLKLFTFSFSLSHFVEQFSTSIKHFSVLSKGRIHI